MRLLWLALRVSEIGRWMFRDDEMAVTLVWFVRIVCRRVAKGGDMKAIWWRAVVGMVVLGCSALAGASDLTIHLKGSEMVARNTVKFQCDAAGVKMGLPAGVFSVEYLNGAGNHLAVVPVGGNSLIFANVISGSGARYAAQQFIWWDAGGRGTTFSSEGLGEKMSSTCHRVQ
jgi:membrane-bound inhibitor of C-type lysozyme